VGTALRGFALPSFGQSAAKGNSPPSEFYLHPHYRAQTPLDGLLLKTAPGLDEFDSETHARNIGAVLSLWSAGLRKAPADLAPITQALAPEFRGVAWGKASSKEKRPGPQVSARELLYQSDTPLGRDAFLEQYKAWLGEQSLLTARFEIPRIHETSSAANSASQKLFQTEVRYEFVGTGAGFHREQRVGVWTIDWQRDAESRYQVVRWAASAETRSQAMNPVFADITTSALGGAACYNAQLQKGTDYWRTVLDAASGIDIYGHNGVAFGDIDGDGFDDLYICQPGGLPNRLFRNRGDGTFEDITEHAGVGILENTACALFLDIDNDGRQDLIVVRTDGPDLYLNQGNNTFRKKPEAFRFPSPPQGTFTGAAAADFDRDGWLDVYFCLYVYYQGTDQYKYPSPYYAAENGPPNYFFRNNRDGTFRDATAETGLNRNNTRYSFCCAWNDYNHDGWPDLYVVNDFGRKNLYRNNGDGTFTDVAAAAGVEDIGAGMSVCWTDYDNDGRPDLYVADMYTAAGERVSMYEAFQQDLPEEVRTLYHKHARGNSLFHNQGNDKFADTSANAGVEIGRWSWSSDAWDFDHDGFPDLYIANGMVSGPNREDLNGFFWRQVVARSPNEAKPSHDYEQGWTALNELLRSDFSWSGYERNVFYANNRDGTFSDVSGCVDLDFLEDARSFGLADIDQDGRLELLLKNRNAPQIRLLKNVAQDLGASICFRLTGSKSNRDAIGAVVTITTSAGQRTKSMQAGSGFLAQHSKELHFGLGDSAGAVRATIEWPSGLEQTLENLPAGHRISVTEGSDQPRLEPFRALVAPKATVSASVEMPLEEQFSTTIETWLLETVEAPDFSLPDAAGQIHAPHQLRGAPALVCFSSSALPSWANDLRALKQLQEATHNSRIAVLMLDFADTSLAGAPRNDPTVPILRGSEDVAGIYSILYRYLFDRHRDIPLPASWLLDEHGGIVKVIQGPIDSTRIADDCRQLPHTALDRLARALPFPGITDAKEFPRNYLSFGSVFYQRGYLDVSEASFRRALADNPQSAEAAYGLGSVYLKQSKTEAARTSFEAATQLTASYPDTLPDAWNNLGLIAARENHFEDAVVLFQKALELSPDHRVALDNLGNAYRQLQRWDDAKATLEHAVAVAPQDPEANYSLGMVYAQLNDTDRAYELLQKALTLRPDYPEALNNLGILYLRTQRRDQAVSTFEQCIRVAPQFDQAYLNLARVYAIEGTPEKARSVLTQLLAVHPDHVQAKAALQQLGNETR
jgi:tetratricopeptide (TPR) repeat protein